MRELQIATEEVVAWFVAADKGTYSLIDIKYEHAKQWVDILANPIRRCYVDDATLETRARELNLPRSVVLAAKLPDEGATMAGDFGEVLVYLCQAALEHPRVAFGAKKWRLKQDRTKPAPYSDVVHFILPTWPEASEHDTILCSEVKTKATPGGEPPVAEAIKDCAKDRTSRLARTLVWLRDRALGEDLGCVQLAQLDRFINLIDYPPPQRRFFAVVVACSSLLADTLARVPTEPPEAYKLLIIAVPDLRSTYSAVFKSVRHSARPIEEPEVTP